MSNIGPRETFLGLQSRAIYWERDGLDPSVRPPARGGGGRRSVRASCCDAGTTYRDRPVWTIHRSPSRTCQVV